MAIIIIFDGTKLLVRWFGMPEIKFRIVRMQ